MATGDTDFRGRGWSFPVSVDRTTHAILEDEGAEKVRQSIWMILDTAPGERVMRPDFGCGIHNLVFESMGEAAIGQLTNEVAEALARWEPRIDVLTVDVSPKPGEPHVLVIAIDYQLRSTNSRFNLVYPFYLS
jgi:Bacteriophage baseplate protein W